MNKKYRYKKEKLIAEGTYGHVFLARDTKTDKKVVIKEVKSKYFVDLAREIHFMRLLHRQCPRYFPAIEQVIYNGDKSTVGLVLDYYPWTLNDLLDHDKKNIYLLPVIQQIMEAYVLMEQNFIRHFDIKPDNILIDWSDDTVEPTIKIIDFGFAEYYSPRQKSCTVCTDGYRAIELFQHRQLDYGIEIDLWAIAVTLIEYYQKKYLFEGDTDEAISKKIEVGLQSLPFDDYYRWYPDFGFIINGFLNQSVEQRLETYLFIRRFVYSKVESISTETDFQARWLVELPTMDQIRSDHFALVERIFTHITIAQWIEIIMTSFEILDVLEETYANHIVWSSFYYYLMRVLFAIDHPIDLQTLYLHFVTTLYNSTQIYYYEALDLDDFFDICQAYLPKIKFRASLVYSNGFKIMRHL